MTIEWYEHYGKRVAVQANLKGKHREHCLCYRCAHFVPEKREENCSIANLVYAVCVDNNLVLPVWECPHFVDREAQS